MSSPTQSMPPTEVRTETMLPRARWWGEFVLAGNPPEQRFVFKWGRIVAAMMALCFLAYLSLATALWGYYSIYRKIPGVNWIDIAIIPRFSRVQTAIGTHYYANAKQLWEKRDFIEAILTARAAVQKAPASLEPRLFLAGCWQQANRYDEAVRTLREGIPFQAAEPRLHQALVETCLTTGRYKELLKILREDLPAHGIHLLRSDDKAFQLAEVRAVLETADVTEAEKVVAQHPGLAELPAAAPLLARIDWDLNRREAAMKRLIEARDRDSKDAGIHDAYVDLALRMGKLDDARAASGLFLKAFPNMVSAQLRFLEAHGSRKGADQVPWMNEGVRFMIQYRKTPAALQRLASLAASQGWSDLSFLLYQNSLQENLTGFPYAIYYASSLVKTGDYAAADRVWKELSVRNAPQLASATYVAAMIATGVGDESEASQIIDRLRRETASDLRRRDNLAQVFRVFNFPKIADELLRAQ